MRTIRRSICGLFTGLLLISAPSSALAEDCTVVFALEDAVTAASLQFVRYVKADVFGDRPRLRAWDERYRARPAAKKVLRW